MQSLKVFDIDQCRAVVIAYGSNRVFRKKLKSTAKEEV